MYYREIGEVLKKWMDSPEILILLGARQVGKSTLLEMLADESGHMKILNCENPVVSDILQKKEISNILPLFESSKIVAFDEAQVIPEIGKILKILFDDKRVSQKIIATGSSSFELADKTGEPLTGRNLKFRMYPLSLSEIKREKGALYLFESLKQMLVFGNYPGIVDLEIQERKRKLLNLTGDYLFKDIYKFESIRNPDLLRRLLKALALQVGSLVSVAELSGLLGISSITVEKYLDLLEKSFVIFKLGSFSGNLRNELKKSRKYYFYDNGIRNAVLNNFIPIEERTDVGALWENFCIAEYVKYLENHEIFSNLYFWRTYDGAEIDLIAEREGKIYAFEFKWNVNKNPSLPSSFSSKYKTEDFRVINPGNILQFID